MNVVVVLPIRSPIYIWLFACLRRVIIISWYPHLCQALEINYAAGDYDVDAIEQHLKLKPEQQQNNNEQTQ